MFLISRDNSTSTLGARVAGTIVLILLALQAWDNSGSLKPGAARNNSSPHVTSQGPGTNSSSLKPGAAWNNSSPHVTSLGPGTNSSSLQPAFVQHELSHKHAAIMSRFLARGDASCLRVAVNPARALVSERATWGWGNQMLRAACLMAVSAVSGRVPFVRMPNAGMELSRYFQAVPAADRKEVTGTCPSVSLKVLDSAINSTAPLMCFEQPGWRTVWRTPFWSTVESDARFRSLKRSGGGSVRSCAMRQYMEHPTAGLLARLSPRLTQLVPGDVLLALHLRFGDGMIQKSTQQKEALTESQLMQGKVSLDRLQAAYGLIDELIHGIESRNSTLRVRIFVSSDVPAGLAAVEHRYGSRLLRIPKTAAFHSNRAANMQESKRSDLTQEMVADWFLLALADVLVQPRKSTFSATASHLGLQGPCAFISGGWTERTFEQSRQLCVDSVVKSMS